MTVTVSFSDATRGHRDAMVSTKRPAVALYEKHGFRNVGTLPEAFMHSRLGLVDAYVMSRPIQASRS